MALSVSTTQASVLLFVLLSVGPSLLLVSAQQCTRGQKDAVKDSSTQPLDTAHLCTPDLLERAERALEKAKVEIHQLQLDNEQMRDNYRTCEMALRQEMMTRKSAQDAMQQLMVELGKQKGLDIKLAPDGKDNDMC